MLKPMGPLRVPAALQGVLLGSRSTGWRLSSTGESGILPRQAPQHRAWLQSAPKMRFGRRRSALHPFLAYLQFEPVDAGIGAVGIAGAVMLHDRLRASVRVPRDVADRQQVAACAIEQHDTGIAQ